MNDLNDAKIQEQIERVIKWRDECAIPAIQKMVDVLVSCVQEIIDAIAPLFGEAIKNMTRSKRPFPLCFQVLAKLSRSF